jgi:hypothetical protein
MQDCQAVAPPTLGYREFVQVAAYWNAALCTVFVKFGMTLEISAAWKPLVPQE